MASHTSPSIVSPRRIVIRGVNWLGDAVMTTPALQRLREHFPQAQITLLTTEKLAGVWLQHPSLNDVLTFATGARISSVAGQLAAGEFDLALVLPNSPRSAMEAWLARIPQRIGYARPWRNWFLTHPVPARPGEVPMRKRSAGEVARLVRDARKRRDPVSLTPPHDPGSDQLSPRSHHIYGYLHLTAALGANPEPLAPKLVVAEEEVSKAQARLLPQIRNGAKATAGAPVIWFGLNPSAAYGPAKRWPVENFAAVVREVRRQHAGCVWLVFGGADDVGVCNEIAARAGGSVINLAGQTTLRELMALLKMCRVLLTNDSGPMHLAAALDTPVVTPFGSTSPELTGPGLPGDPRHHLLRAQAPCSPCFRRTCPIDFRCMTGIAVEQVLGAVLTAARSSESAPAT